MSKQKIIIGIDPGLSGGIAVVALDHTKIHAMPTQPVRVGTAIKRTLDMAQIIDIFAEFEDTNTEIIIEAQQSMPNQGVTSSYNNGYHYGLLIGMLLTKYNNVKIVRAKTWKQYYPRLQGHTRNEQKDIAREIATELSEDNAHEFVLKKDDGKAEALLLAQYYIGIS